MAATGTTALLEAHYPSMTRADEAEIAIRLARGEDAAELALRTCACGKHVDGFYEYVDHLKDVLRGQDA